MDDLQQQERAKEDQALKEKFLLSIGKLVNTDQQPKEVDFVEEGRLFDLFNNSPVFAAGTPVPGQVELLDVMSMLLEALNGGEVLVKYYDHVVDGLDGALRPLQIVDLWLKKLVRPVFSSEGQLKVVVNSSVNINGLLRSTVRLLAAEDTGVAAAAHDISVVAAKAFRQNFFSPVLIEELRKLKDYKGSYSADQASQKRLKNLKTVDRETVQIRLYEPAAARYDERPMACCPELVADFEAKLSVDPLVALNMLKLMTDLASTPHTIAYLRTSTSVLQSVAKRLELKKDGRGEGEEDIWDALILPGCINFFIRLAEFDLSVLEDSKYGDLLEARLLAMLSPNSSSTESLVLAVDSVAYLCRKNAGKRFVGEQKPVLGTAALDRIAAIITGVGATELKARALSALASMLELTDDSDPGSKAAQLTERWYQQVDQAGAGLPKLMAILAEPLPELRLPALNLLRVLATTAWGQQALVTGAQGGPTAFLDYLLDRRTETTAEGREAKYAVVRELVMSPFVRLSFPPEALLRLRAYYKAGAFAREADEEVSVAFGSAS
ncbi:26S proteasome non-ATPase regulatory subunit 5 [Tyrophagus putrescentiae]|nr:26S proteasome non-ATPase regulatory subunit 5 [Tyrophagus putrescentiae]